MLKRIISCAALFLALSMPGFAFAAEADNLTERIASFDVDIGISNEPILSVTEKITYDSGDREVHGIYREIPLSNYSGSKIRIMGVSVRDETGGDYPFVSDIHYVKGAAHLRLKIGDPEKVWSGRKTYVISYIADNAIGYFSDLDEVYWNATGNGWEFPIEKARVAIRLPEGAVFSQGECYIGVASSREKCLYRNDQGGAIAFFESGRVIMPGEGMTVAAGFPKGSVREMTFYEKLSSFMSDSWWLVFLIGIPAVTSAVLFTKWRKGGKDPDSSGVIIPQYDVPDGLTPMESALILKQRSVAKDIAAEMVYLAVNGYLKIIRIEEKGYFFDSTDYELKLLRSPDDLRNDFDKELLDALFNSSDDRIRKSVRVSSLKGVFYKRIGGIRKLLNSGIVSKGYYASDPSAIRMKYAGLGAMFLVLSVLGAALLPVAARMMIGAGGLVGVAAGFAVSAIISFVFAFIMPAKTKKGVEAMEHLLGLRDYVDIAEKDRIKFHNAPEKKPELFEKLLPFAMIFGLEKQWAREFDDIYSAPPEWYSDPSGGAFNAGVLAGNLSSFGSVAANSLSSHPSSGAGSGGGGFSGGGGGGGGGGSW